MYGNYIELMLVLFLYITHVQAHKIFDRVHDIDLTTLDSEAIGQVVLHI